MLQNIDSRMRDLPPMWVIEMGELILQGAARRWQGLMAAAIRASTVEYMNERTNMEMTGEERDMVLKCMRDIGINSHPEEPEPLEDEQKETENENTEPDQLNREQENEKEQKEQDKESEHNQTETEQENVIEQNIEACFPPPPPSNETEETPQAEKEASEERDNHIDLPQGERTAAPTHTGTHPQDEENPSNPLPQRAKKTPSLTPEKVATSLPKPPTELERSSTRARKDTNKSATTKIINNKGSMGRTHTG
ncbi:zinc finger and BTB domain-containing protein 47-like [Penaeus monodon]|uniref:zinc finger and BTB domain-containing protein 47-like n=1 Tax=Penaeus monodon TaxID=6687 RepID=UPI0018A755A6|nr:zinc finger and BTB domain-containing protein 47-like [Penaeus monodon]